MVYDVVIFIQSMNHLGGTEIVALNLKNALNEYGTRTIILSVEEYDGKDKDVIYIQEKDRRKYDIRQLSSIKKLLGSESYQNAVTNFLRDFCLENGVKALLNFTYENLLCVPTDIERVKTFGVYHWSLEGYESSLINIIKKKFFFTRLVSEIVLYRTINKLHQRIGATNYAIALTQSGANELKRLSKEVMPYVIPNFLPEKTNVLDQPKCKKINKRAVFVGRLSQEKGVYHLLDIWEIVLKECPDAELYIYGVGSEAKNMQEIIGNKALSGIKMMGFESNLDKIYGDADMLICTSETEGFGMVLIEAMQHGIIPFSFDCPVSPKELIGDAGIVVPCFDINEYSRQIVTLWMDVERMDKLRELGLKRSKAFEKEKVIKLWQDLING